jgi:hypothetical protein
MLTPPNSLLIADVCGRINERCEPGPAVHGEIWLRRHEGLLVVYWDVRELPTNEDGTPAGRRPGYTNAGMGVAVRNWGAGRWQAMCVLTTDDLPDEVKDLATAFGNPAHRDALLAAALKAVNVEIYGPFERGRFLERAHRWREPLRSV